MLILENELALTQTAVASFQQYDTGVRGRNSKWGSSMHTVSY